MITLLCNFRAFKTPSPLCNAASNIQSYEMSRRTMASSYSSRPGCGN